MNVKRLKFCCTASAVLIGALAGLTWALVVDCYMKKPFKLMCGCIANDAKKAFRDLEKKLT